MIKKSFRLFIIFVGYVPVSGVYGSVAFLFYHSDEVFDSGVIRVRKEFA